MSEVSMTDIAAKSLGDSTSYAVYTDTFDASLLNPMPRTLAREQWGITGKEFVGYDVWHGHEATFLLSNGCPVAGTVKIVYSSGSEFMVESKSAKLYLNSFDMCKMGPTLVSAIAAYEAQIAHDLSTAINSDVKVKFFDSSTYIENRHANLLSGYQDLATVIPNLESTIFTDYYGASSHIVGSGHPGEINVFTNALRSRCRHTKQKDTGLAMVHHKSNSQVIDELSLFKQIVSLRELNEFHEFCAEKIFCEILKVAFRGDEIALSFIYSRRGSLDICPVRASSYALIPQALVDVNQLTIKVQGQ